MKKLFILVCVALWSTFAQAQWPDRPVKLIIPYSAGGTTDILIRTIQPRLTELLKQPVNIEYAPGASSAIGAAKAAVAKDNHTFLVTADEFVTNTITDPSGNHAMQNFRTVSFLASSPIMIATAVDSPYRDAKANLSNSNISYGNAGVNSISNLLLRKTNPNWISVSYKGGAPMFTDVIPGTVNLSSSSVLQATTYIQAGKLAPVMIYSKNRHPAYPDTPTSHELGIQLDAPVWLGVVAPKSTSDDAVSRISSAFMSAMKDTELTRPLVERGLTINPMDHRQFDTFLQQNARQVKNLL